jgi:hypothetical protein
VHDTAYALGATISYSGTVTYVYGTDAPPTLITVNLRYNSVLSGTITDSHQSAPTVFMGSGSWNGGVIARQDPGFHKAVYFLQAVPENSGTTYTVTGGGLYYTSVTLGDIG